MSSIVKRKTNTNPSFLGLPGEVRNLIYDFVFANIEDEVVLPITRPKTKFTDRIKRKVLIPRSKRVPHLALLMTCRQIRAEAFGYVHGVVHAGLATKYNFIWQAKRVLLDDLRQEMNKALRRIGEDLPFVSHLDLVGPTTLATLAQAHNTQASLKRLSRNPFVRRDEKLALGFIRVSEYLPNLTCVSIFGTEFDSLHRDDWLAMAMMLRSERHRVAATFPHLVDIRIESKTKGMRYEKKADGEWYERPGGRKVWCIEH